MGFVEGDNWRTWRNACGLKERPNKLYYVIPSSGIECEMQEVRDELTTTTPPLIPKLIIHALFKDGG